MTVQNVNGETRVDVRQHHELAGEISPTNHGVHFVVYQFMNLFRFIDEINVDYKELRSEKLKMFNFNMGDNLFITSNVDRPVVLIRAYFTNESESEDLSLESEIALTYEEWESFVAALSQIKECVYLHGNEAEKKSTLIF